MPKIGRKSDFCPFSPVHQSHLQSGSVSLLVIIIVCLAIGLSYGVVAVAEAWTNKRQVEYGVQSSANAAAFSYGQTIVQEMDQCLKKKMQDTLDHEELEEDSEQESCSRKDVQACLDSDFEECSIDLNLCISEDLIKACEEDPEVKEKAMGAAQTAAKTVGGKYELEKFDISLSDQKMTVKAEKDLHGQVAKFGLSGRVEAEGKSAYSIRRKDQDE